MQNAGLAIDQPLVLASGGQRNQTWICGGFVVRMNSQQNGALFRLEAELLARLADVIPCPQVYAVRADQRGERSIQQKVAGRPLAHAWPELDSAMRQRAVEQLADMCASFQYLPGG
ncbi:MAG: phosphotransferase [Caldilineaceae bacterium]